MVHRALDTRQAASEIPRCPGGKGDDGETAHPEEHLGYSLAMPPPPVALVTGASSGIGSAVAKRLSREGFSLVLLARREDRLRALAAELSGESCCAAVDVRDKTAFRSAIEGLPPAFSEISVLVNNAGLAAGLEKAQAAKLEDWETMIETNVLGLLYATHAVLPGMVARDRGHVVNLGSVAASYPYPGGNVYGATKAFVKQLSLNLRADLLGTRVRVTDVEPGMVETDFSKVRFGGDEERAKAVYAGMQALSPDDIADVVAYCVKAPPHVNVNRIEIMPVAQAFSPFAVHRG